MNKAVLLILFTFSVHAQKCPKGIINSIGLNEVNSLTGDFVSYTNGTSSRKCIDKIDPQRIYDYDDSVKDDFCECVNSSKDINIQKSRANYRSKRGVMLLGTFNDLYKTLDREGKRNPSLELPAGCNLNTIVKSNCSETEVKELFPKFSSSNIASYIKEELQILNGHKSSSIKQNSCKPSNVITEEIKENTNDPLEMIKTQCNEIKVAVADICKNEVLRPEDSNELAFNVLLEPSMHSEVDNYSYYCKLSPPDANHVKVEHSASFSDSLRNIRSNVSSDEDTEAFCKDICDDKGPYPITGCKVNLKKLPKVFEEMGCKTLNKYADAFDHDCQTLKDLQSIEGVKILRERKLSSNEKEYFKEQLSEKDYSSLIALNNDAPVDPAKAGNLVDQFFSSEKSDTNKIETNKAQVSPTTKKVNSTATTVSEPIDSPVQNARQVAEETPVITPTAKRSNASIKMRFNSPPSKYSKDIIDTVKSLRSVGSSLQDAIDYEKKAIEEQANRISELKNKENEKNKIQRYDPFTLEPIEQEDSSSNNRVSDYDSWSPSSSSNINARSMGDYSGASASSTAARATGSSVKGSSGNLNATQIVTDISGRAAKDLDLLRVSGKGVILPMSVANSPDASEISKLFNGVDYKKHENTRGPASEKKEIRKIKVDWNTDYIDLGKILLLEKDISPGEEFVIYKGDMEMSVKIVPAYHIRNGKRTFIGYQKQYVNPKSKKLSDIIHAQNYLLI